VLRTHLNQLCCDNTKAFSGNALSLQPRVNFDALTGGPYLESFMYIDNFHHLALVFVVSCYLKEAVMVCLRLKSDVISQTTTQVGTQQTNNLCYHCNFRQRQLLKDESRSGSQFSVAYSVYAGVLYIETRINILFYLRRSFFKKKIVKRCWLYLIFLFWKQIRLHCLEHSSYQN